jgi:sugar O-acyltransferase (sialic acid O-acetyltransferase NeuD family)
MSGPKQLILLGDSLFAEIAHEYFEHASDYEVVAFSVEQAYMKRESFRGLPVIPFERLEHELDPAAHSVYAALTYGTLNRVRQRLAGEAKAKGYALASYVSSRAFVWRNVTLGEHCFIFENNTVQPFVSVGDNCVLWSGNHIGHHSSIGNNVFIASQAVIAGSVKVGDNSFIGINATVVNDIEIGNDCWLGPHTVVTRSLPPQTLVKPARSENRDGVTHRMFGVSE